MGEGAMRVGAWLDAVARGEWEAVWSAYAPEALLVVGLHVLPKSRIPLQGYVDHQRSAATLVLPQYQPSFHLLEASEMPVADGTVVLAQLRVDTDAAPVTAGFQFDAGGGLLGMVVDPVSPHQVAAEAAGELAQLPGNAPWSHSFLTALHHSYVRRRKGLAEKLRVLPEARFTCQGRGDCCRPAKWGIEVSTNELLAIGGMTKAAGTQPLPFQAAKGPAAEFGNLKSLTVAHKMVATVGEECDQVGGDRSCGIHRLFGWQPIPICALYPVHAIKTPDGMDLMLAFSCESVCRNQGELLGKQPVGLRQRLWPYQHNMPNVGTALPVAKGTTDTIPWSTYRLWEDELLELLNTLPAQGDDALRAGSDRLSGWLAGNLNGPAASVDAVFRRLTQDGAEADSASFQVLQESRQAAPAFAPDWEMVSRYLRSVLFRKEGLWQAGPSAALPWAATLVAYRLVKTQTLVRAGRAGRRLASDEDLVAAIRAVDHQVFHTKGLNPLLALSPNPLESAATWRALID